MLAQTVCICNVHAATACCCKVWLCVKPTAAVWLSACDLLPGTRDDPLPATGSFAMKLVKAVRCCPVLVVKANSRGPYLRSDNGAMGALGAAAVPLHAHTAPSAHQTCHSGRQMLQDYGLQSSSAFGYCIEFYVTIPVCIMHGMHVSCLNCRSIKAMLRWCCTAQRSV